MRQPGIREQRGPRAPRARRAPAPASAGDVAAARCRRAAGHHGAAAEQRAGTHRAPRRHAAAPARRAATPRPSSPSPKRGGWPAASRLAASASAMRRSHVLERSREASARPAAPPAAAASSISRHEQVVFAGLLAIEPVRVGLTHRLLDQPLARPAAQRADFANHGKATAAPDRPASSAIEMVVGR